MHVPIPGLKIVLSIEPVLVFSLCCTLFLHILQWNTSTSTAATIIITAVITSRVTVTIILIPIPSFDLVSSPTSDGDGDILIEGDIF